MPEVNQKQSRQCVAFRGEECLAQGAAADVVAKLLAEVSNAELPQIQIFDCEDSRPIELDLRLSPEALKAQFQKPASSEIAEIDSGVEPVKKRGRPRLGVVSKEVTLLPRHWEWLAAQPGGASVALRRLVEQAKKTGAEKERVRSRQEACYRFMYAMAGDRPNFEEATRALYAREEALFLQEIARWPQDIRAHTRTLASEVFSHGPG